MAKRSVGGAARRIASESPGSSPGVSIKENRINVLRRMLRYRDKLLCRYDSPWYRETFMRWSNKSKYEKLDAERRAIREKIKMLAKEKKCQIVT